MTKYQEVPSSYILRSLDACKLLIEELEAARDVKSLNDSIFHMKYARKQIQDIITHMDCFENMLNVGKKW